MILAYAAFLGVCLAIQGFFILSRGTAAPFFLASRPGTKPLRTAARFANSLLFVSMSAVVLAIVGRLVVTRRGGVAIGNIGPALFLVLIGIFLLVRPDIAVWYGRRSNPNLAGNTFTLAMARIVAALLLFGGLLFIT